MSKGLARSLLFAAAGAAAARFVVVPHLARREAEKRDPVLPGRPNAFEGRRKETAALYASEWGARALAAGAAAGFVISRALP